MKHQIHGALYRLGCGGSADTNALVRTVLLTDSMITGEHRYQHVRLPKDLSRNRCHAPEIGLVHDFARQDGTTKPNCSASNRGGTPDGLPRR